MQEVIFPAKHAVGGLVRFPLPPPPNIRGFTIKFFIRGYLDPLPGSDGTGLYMTFGTQGGATANHSAVSQTIFPTGSLSAAPWPPRLVALASLHNHGDARCEFIMEGLAMNAALPESDELDILTRVSTSASAAGQIVCDDLSVGWSTPVAPPLYLEIGVERSQPMPLFASGGAVIYPF